MKTTLLLVAAAVVATLAGSGAASAHHGAAAYDMNHVVTVTGVVTDFQFVNPHSQIYIDVKNANGETERWQGEITAPTKLARAGWSKNTLKPGDTITMTGAQLRSGKHAMVIRKLIGPDGQPLPLSED